MNIEQLRNKIIGKPLGHAVTFVREQMDSENRTVPILFSTETPILHWFGYLILSHDDKSVKLDRLNNGAPLLKDHIRYEQIGKIESATIDAKERVGRAMVRYSKANPVAEIEWKDMLDGIRTKASVGFQIHTLVPEVDAENKEIKIDDIPVYRAILWEPHEISIVSIEADVNAGVNRMLADGEMDDAVIEKIAQRMLEIQNNSQSQSPKGDTTMFNRSNILMDPDPQKINGGGPAPAPAINESEIRAKETQRINAIDATAKFAVNVPNITDIRNKAVNDGWTAEKFAHEVMPLMSTHSVTIDPNKGASENLGLSAKDVRGFSLRRAIHQLTVNHALSGAEKAVNDHILKFEKRDGRELTVRVPVDLLMRDLNTGTPTAGGNLVGTDLLGSEFIEMKRNQTIVEKAGARLLSGLVGNIAIPKQSGGATAYWLAEGATGTLNDQSFAQIAMTPHRLFAGTAFTKQLAFQASIGVENFITGDIQKVLKIAKDLAALNGSGADGQPLGVLNLTGMATAVTFSTAATFAKMIEFETNVATQNADEGALAYVTTPGVRGKLKAKAKDTNGSGFVWEKGMVNDYPAFATNQVPSNLVVFGNWNDLVIGEWAGVDITVDPYTLAADGKIRIIIEMHCDVVARHAASFCKSTDSGAQ